MTPAIHVAMYAGSFALVGAVMTIVFLIIAVSERRRADELAKEGLVRRSGRTWIKVTLVKYRSATRYAGRGMSINRGELILTERALVVLAVRTYRFEREDLAHVRAYLADGRLHLETDQPPKATGRIEVAVTVSDGGPWLDALVAAGVQPSG